MSLVDTYDSVLLDLDGVLFRGAAPIAGAPETVEALRSRGKGIVFMTNNASRTPEQVAAQLARVGIASAAEEVETAALTAARILSERGVERVFAIGQDGVLEALARAGIAVVALEDRPEAVVVGLDRAITYDKLRDASLAVQRGAQLVATNGDTTFPAEDGLWPGAGALLAAVVATTGATPEVLGKPDAAIFRSSLERAGGGRPLVVGDRLDTDIAGAAALGWDSLLVLTGVTVTADLENSDIRPTYVAQDVTALLEEAPPAR